LSVERETPIDRWMGWNTKSVDSPQDAVGSKSTCRNISLFVFVHFVFVSFTYTAFPFPYPSTFFLTLFPSSAPLNFIDSMDTKNYVSTSLAKPMGIVFEENDSEFGGIFVLEITEGSSAEIDGTLRPGDQLVSVGGTKVSGLQFEEALGKIIESTEEKVKLVFFRGPAKFLYGPAGASQSWLDEFIKGEAQ